MRRQQGAPLSELKVVPDAAQVSDCRAAGILAVSQAMPLTSRRLGQSADPAPAKPVQPTPVSSLPVHRSGGDRLEAYRKSIEEVSRALESTDHQGRLLILDVIGKVGSRCAASRSKTMSMPSMPFHIEH